MNLNEIKEIIKAVDLSSITEFQIENENLKILIKKESVRKVIVEQNEVVQDRVEEIVEKKEEIIENKKADHNIPTINSPILGTFYATPSPDSPPFVKAGDRIKKGDVLCIIEAMKLMNEVTADMDGEIEEVLVENGSLVEYGQPLFRVRKV